MTLKADIITGRTARCLYCKRNIVTGTTTETSVVTVRLRRPRMARDHMCQPSVVIIAWEMILVISLLMSLLTICARHGMMKKISQITSG